MPLLFIGSPPGFAARSLEKLWNLGHTALFCLAVYGSAALRPTWVGERFARFAVSALAMTLLLAVGIEWAQGFVGRERSTVDILLSGSGGLLGILLTAPRFRQTPTLIGLWVVTSFGTLTPLSLAMFDEARARRAFPILSDFERKIELSRWGGSARLEWVPPESGEHNGALVAHIEPRRNGIHLAHFPEDWTGYRSLRIRLKHDGEHADFTCRINDLAHDLAVPHEPTDHYEQTFTLKRGWQEVRIDLVLAANGLRDREMQLTEMNSMTCMLITSQDMGRITIDRVDLGP